jgi:uncharacterized coiled-coil DUF342 family protein
MRLPLSLAIALCTAVVIIGCESKSDHEAITDEMVAKLREMVDVVKGIKDEQSAQAARPKMVALKKDTDALKAKADQMGNASPAAERRIKEKHEKELRRLNEEMQVELMRIIQDPNIAPHMREAVQGL